MPTPLLFTCLACIAFIAGVFTEDRLWFTAMVLMEPLLLARSREHGGPIEWVIGVILDPLDLPIFLWLIVLNLTPFLLTYWCLLLTGKWVRSRVARRPDHS
jgi:hypothetical protein